MHEPDDAVAAERASGQSCLIAGERQIRFGFRPVLRGGIGNGFQTVAMPGIARLEGFVLIRSRRVAISVPLGAIDRKASRIVEEPVRA